MPRTWTAEQALSVIDFLQTVIDDVWDVYRDELRELQLIRTPPNE